MQSGVYAKGSRGESAQHVCVRIASLTKSGPHAKSDLRTAYTGSKEDKSSPAEANHTTRLPDSPTQASTAGLRQAFP